jgi:hypothetical protein
MILASIKISCTPESSIQYWKAKYHESRTEADSMRVTLSKVFRNCCQGDSVAHFEPDRVYRYLYGDKRGYIYKVEVEDDQE